MQRLLGIFRVWDLELRVQGFGLNKEEGVGFMVQGLTGFRLRIEG